MEQKSVQQEEAVLARRLARELEIDEIDDVSGGYNLTDIGDDYKDGSSSGSTKTRGDARVDF